jgi:hypothetical protein
MIFLVALVIFAAIVYFLGYGLPEFTELDSLKENDHV